MFALFVMAIPCLGVIMIIVWALVGENETRKNYFRALIAWFLIMLVAWVIIMLCGFWPIIAHQIQVWTGQVVPK